MIEQSAFRSFGGRMRVVYEGLCLRVQLVENRRRYGFQQLIVDEPLDVFAACNGLPMRPGAVDEVKEGQVGDATTLSAGLSLA